MFDTVLSYATNPVVLCAVALVAGVVFSQKIKDWFAGIDGDTRAAIVSLEGTVQAKLSAARADVLSSIIPVKQPAAVPVPPAAPVVAPDAPKVAPAPGA